MIGESRQSSTQENIETVSILETNIDDLSPQVLGHFMDRALGSGALDCWFTPIQMKKNRPATKISVLCRAQDESRLLELLYRETSTIGVRIQRMERHSLERSSGSVTTVYGEISVKTSYIDGEAVNSQPEFEEIKAAAAANGVSVKVVAEAVAKCKN